MLDTRIARQWDEDIVPQLIEYIRLPAKSPHFDPEWRRHGHIEASIRQAHAWAAKLAQGEQHAGKRHVGVACFAAQAQQGRCVRAHGLPVAALQLDQLVPQFLDAVGQLVDLVGPAYAKDILFSGRVVSDQEALATGFVQRLLPPDELEAYTYDYLRKVAENAPLSVRGAKLTVHARLAGLTDERRQRLKDLALEAFESEDYKEGTRAFLEKRSPKFQGR